MLLSKQDFSKLSKADKAILMRGKQLPKKTKSGKVRRKSTVTPFQSRAPKQSFSQGSVAAAYATTTSGRAPNIVASRDSCRVQHKEFIGNVSGTVLFTLLKLVLNPGLGATFPWLSTIANSWEEYRFRYLRIRYLTRTGSTTPGSIIIAPDYDASDADPSSETVLSSYQDSRGDAPWKDLLVPISRVDMSGPVKRHFVRSSALAANQDIKLYDVANVFVATTDGTAVPWGKLWIEYDVEFFVPQLPPTGAVSLKGGLIIGNTTITKANPFGTAPQFDPDETGVTVNGGSIMTFSANGDYVLAWNVIGTAIVPSIDPTVTVGVALVPADTSGDVSAASTTETKRVCITVTNFITGSLQFGACYSAAGTITAIRMIASQLPLGSVG